MKKLTTLFCLIFLLAFAFSVHAGLVIGSETGEAAGSGNNFGDANCVALWRFESGALTTDSKGGNTLTDHATVTENTADYKEGSCSADFEKDSSQYFNITDGNLTAEYPLKNGDTNKKISVCGWFRMEALPGLNHEYLYAKYDTAGKRSFAILVDKVTDKLQLNIGHTNGDDHDPYLHASALSVDKWYHYGVTWQDSDKSYRIRIWDDDAGATLGVDSNGTGSNNINVEDAEVSIGSRAGGIRFFDGEQDELVVFKDILSAAEIDQIRGGTYGGGGGINPPTVTTQAVDSIHDTNATGHGNITATGGENCSKRGICWDTAPMPTRGDNYAEDSGSFGVGAFSKLMTELSANTTYYVRAYAPNSSGYSYGDQVEFNSSGSPPPGCSWYVDTGGDDGTGNGTSGNPWLTVAYTLSQSSFGEMICVNDGTYNESQMVIPAGVSLKSTSDNATLVTLQPNVSMNSSTPFLKLVTASPGSDGNQTISYLTLDGNTGTYTARIGIKIENRNNIRIHHCNISDFSSGTLSHGVWVASTEIAQTDNWQNYWPYDPQEPGNDVNIDGVWPANPVSGFELDHNTITNCGYRVALSSGPIWCSVRLYHLKDSSIYDNTINVGNSKAQCICGICAILHNVDIYNNDLDMTHYSDRSSYIVEIWLLRNGCEIYNNEANACFSICAGKETKVYNNTILSTKIYTTGGNIGIECMIQTHGEVFSNYVQNAKTYGMDAGLSWRHGGYRVEDTAIYNNIIYNTYGTGICIQAEGSDKSGKDIIVSGIKIFNNTIDNSDQPWGLIRLQESDDVSNASLEASIKNNILTNGNGHAGKTVGTVSSTIDYNLFYGNGTNDWLDDTDTNTVVANPVYVAAGDKPDYFKIQTGSNAIDAGTNSVNGTVTDDYWGTARDANIDIGAHEYTP